MRLGLILAAMAGIALGTGLVLYYGLDDVGDAFLAAGWLGIAAITAVHIVTLLLCSLAWHVLLVGPAPRHSYLLFTWARWLRDSVANLIGVVPGAGEVAAARELTLRGIAPAVAAATSVIDLTTELLSQLIFTLIGLAIVIAERPEAQGTWWAGAGLAIATIAIVGFVVAQRNGLLSFVESLPRRLGLLQDQNGASAIDGTHAAVQDIYAEPGRVAASIALHLAAWIIGTAEAWVALRLMGHPLPIMDIVALEALLFAVRAVAFVVPSAIGVQEGGYVVLGAIFGMTPDIALALSLLKRAREITTGAPALVIWQILESRRLWHGWGARPLDKSDTAPSKPR